MAKKWCVYAGKTIVIIFVDLEKLVRRFHVSSKRDLPLFARESTYEQNRSSQPQPSDGHPIYTGRVVNLKRTKPRAFPRLSFSLSSDEHSSGDVFGSLDDGRAPSSSISAGAPCDMAAVDGGEKKNGTENRLFTSCRRQHCDVSFWVIDFGALRSRSVTADKPTEPWRRTLRRPMLPTTRPYTARLDSDGELSPA